MGSKYYQLDNNGELVVGSVNHYSSGKAVRYEITKDDHGYIHRRVSLSGNAFWITDRLKSVGYYGVDWIIDVQENPSNSWSLRPRFVEVGQFEKLKDAEKFAMKQAFEYKDLDNRYAYHPTLVDDENKLTIDILPFFNKKLEPVELSKPHIVVDKQVIEANWELAKLREQRKQERLNGKEDTRVAVKVNMNIDLKDLEEVIAEYLRGEVSTVDGVGADSESVYNVDDVEVTVESTGAIEATFYLERESGKFASTDDLLDGIVTQLNSSSVDVPIEVS
jgi:hypothetical protein